MCEVEISDSNMVEVDDFHGIAVTYGDYEVADDEYEEVTCEAEDSQGLLIQGIDGRKWYTFVSKANC